MTETDDAYLVEVDLPGVRRKGINVDAIGTEITISGELEETERAGLLRRCTRRIGHFEYREGLAPADQRREDHC